MSEICRQAMETLQAAVQDAVPELHSIALLHIDLASFGLSSEFVDGRNLDPELLVGGQNPTENDIFIYASVVRAYLTTDILLFHTGVSGLIDLIEGEKITGIHTQDVQMGNIYDKDTFRFHRLENFETDKLIELDELLFKIQLHTCYLRSTVPNPVFRERRDGADDDQELKP